MCHSWRSTTGTVAVTVVIRVSQFIFLLTKLDATRVRQLKLLLQLGANPLHHLITRRADRQ